MWGSHSHDTNIPGSDYDYLGVYVAPTRVMLSLDPAPDTIQKKDPDMQIHEAAKFARLLMKGNPGIIECLFTEKMQYCTNAWNKLRLYRDQFLTKRCVKQYLGYCQGQLHKLVHAGGKSGLHTSGGKYNTKWAYHLIRLAHDAERIAKGEFPTVWKEGEERELLMSIRRGEFSKEKIEQMGTAMIRKVDGMKPWDLPEEPDKRLLNDWLWDVRSNESGVL